MPFRIIRNDITRVETDAVVNSANPKPIAASGTERAIYEAAGYDELLAERKKIGPLWPGNAAISPAFGLPSKYVIHTVAPEYIDGSHGEENTLRSCYRSSLLLAEEYDCRSVAFPLLASGVNGYPKEQALRAASEEIRLFLNTTDSKMDVVLVVFDKAAVRLSESFYEGLDSFINDEYVEMQSAAEYNYDRYEEERELRGRGRGRRKLNEFFMHSGVSGMAASNVCYEEEDESSSLSEPVSEDAGLFEQNHPAGVRPGKAPAKPSGHFEKEKAPKGSSLEDVLSSQGETFHHMLFRLIDEKEMKDADVYKKTNISRQNFSKIRSNADVKPKKGTILELSLALELNIDQVTDLLASAGYAFSPGNKDDLLVRYFIEHKNYDLDEVAGALYDYHLPDLNKL